MSEEQLLHKWKAACQGLGTKWLKRMATQVEYGNKNGAGQTFQSEPKECLLSRTTGIIRLSELKGTLEIM